MTSSRTAVHPSPTASTGNAPRRRRPLLALIALLGPLLISHVNVVSAQVEGTIAEPLPLDVAQSLRHHRSRAPINMSPDGEWIAHTVNSDETVAKDSVSRFFSATGVPLAEGDSRPEATLSHTRTGEVIRLGAVGSASWAPVWSPDGQQVAFYSDEGGTAGLWIWERTTRST